MFDPITERWPPVYDAAELAATITSLVESGTLQSKFYQNPRRGPQVCQGDIVRLPSAIPVIDHLGQPAALDETVYHWLVIGNTCDFARRSDDVRWSQLVPLFDLGSKETLTAEQIRAITAYRTSRRFHVPAWSTEVSGRFYVADFLLPVAADKEALSGIASVEARMSVFGWVLLHSCLVRFLARDDGRFD
ncbi:MAG: hypothetical protein A2289_21185 [Deltaproteobacteria bacterium RIFOXYA12_FULL_58_15]|nr:MAG: hypothetical protein A2289_21185 [Deltaproteobacteria bacterium RIFOXYA12_FULL_58_15]OGR08719.1 MAG: hypothetical protein A2341_00795 [Deltaproteobacteria bacterium RIFOXYB12_FULL_58_9]